MNAKTELLGLIAELEPKANQFDEVAAKLASAEERLAELIKNADETTAIAKDLTIENAELHVRLISLFFSLTLAPGPGFVGHPQSHTATGLLSGHG